MLTTIILPRLARDKHRKRERKEMRAVPPQVGGVSPTRKTLARGELSLAELVVSR